MVVHPPQGNGVKSPVELPVAASVEAVTDDLAGRRRDRSDSGQGSESSLGADTPTVGPGTDDLTGADGTDSRLGFENGSEFMNQSSQLLLTGGRLCPRISARRATERNAWLVI